MGDQDTWLVLQQATDAPDAWTYGGDGQVSAHILHVLLMERQLMLEKLFPSTMHPCAFLLLIIVT